MIELSECCTVKLFAIVYCDFFGYAKVAAVISQTALASIHFEKYSTATAAYLKLPGAVGRGPTMSMPHRARGQTGGIRWTSSGGNLL